jgi:T5SS/PEP-CTERM-associated repeat protein
MLNRIQTRFLRLTLPAAVLTGIALPAAAAITVNGSVSPSPLGASPFFTIVGSNSEGSLSIDSGSVLMSTIGRIGSLNEGMGTVTVSGSGSVWENKLWLTVGYAGGTGVLNILDGGAVNVTGETKLASRFGSAGSIHFDQGSLSTGSLLTDFSWLTGTGTIATHGLIADEIDLVFDATRGLQQTLSINDLPGQNITVQLDQTDAGVLGAAYTNGGTLTIRDGLTVNSLTGIIGDRPGSSGSATVSGPGSIWNNRGLILGREGDGSLTIADGAVVNVAIDTRLSDLPGSAGSILLDNGVLNTRALYADLGRVSGSGTINTNGLIADGIDLVFDASHGLQQTIQLDEQPGQNVTLNIDHQRRDVLGAGYTASGTVSLSDGTVIESSEGMLGYLEGSTGIMNVSGTGTVWWVDILSIGVNGHGEMNVTDGGLAKVDYLSLATTDIWGIGSGFINLSDGGMLALKGDVGDSLNDFYWSFGRSLGRTDVIRYWDDDLNDWAGVTQATPGIDYTLEYFDTGDLAGYTVLTVGTVPEPHTLAIVGLGLCLSGRRVWPR